MSTNENLPAPAPIPDLPDIPISPEAVVIDAAVDVAKEAMRCFTDYAKCREQEITERQRISACLSAVNRQIDANKAISLEIINRSFNEREKLYAMAQKTLDRATEMGDFAMLTQATDFILKVYQQTPDTSGLISNILGNTPKLF